MNEASELRCLAYHPSGDYLLAGTNNPTLRLYDVETFQCFVSPHASDQHQVSLRGRYWEVCASDQKSSLIMTHCNVRIVYSRINQQNPMGKNKIITECQILIA